MNSTDSLSRGSYLRSLYDETCGLVCFGWMLDIIRRLSRGEVLQNRKRIWKIRSRMQDIFRS